MTTMHFSVLTGFLSTLAGLSFHRTHLLSALLCLEGMMLSLFLALSLWCFQLASMNFSSSPVFLLAFSACEASAGLGLLVATARTHASDHTNNYTLLQC
uniref:NADH-ubiquinone oxidoreductase chain 4L n=1 Tax=Trimma corallinum TaxID=1402054 RepID=A0A455TR76_9GOBI|nr:NADH dehydrogenase subunit 4L [Trimma corallinum]